VCLAAADSAPCRSMSGRNDNAVRTTSGVLEQAPVDIALPDDMVGRKAFWRKKEKSPFASLVAVPTDRIRIHPEIEMARKELGLRKRSGPWMGWLTVEGMLTLNDEVPMQAIKQDGWYLCFGGFRSYLALRDMVSPPARVNVLLFDRVTSEMIGNRILANDVVLPIVHRTKTRMWSDLAHWVIYTTNFYVRRLFPTTLTLGDWGRAMQYHPRSLAKGKAPRKEYPHVYS
jgi:hypothetical protein